MVKEKAAMSASSSSGIAQILGELVQTGIYKGTQGRFTRQVTCIAIWVTFALGAWRLYSAGGLDLPYKYVVPAVVLFAGLWFGYRIVNYHPFADFLIAVEAEMRKVSWPSRTELVRSSLVVIIMIFGLTVILFSYDIIWHELLILLQVIPSG